LNYTQDHRSNDYWYDNAGNIERDNQRRFTNNTFNKPTRITKSGCVVDFSYGAGGKRYKRVETDYSKSSQPKQIHYVGNVEFVKEPTQGHWIAKRYIGDKILITKVGITESVRYMLTDHLGSTHVITDANGTRQQEMSFDVFGARRSATTWAREHHKISLFTSNITLRGYTAKVTSASSKSWQSSGLSAKLFSLASLTRVISASSAWPSISVKGLLNVVLSSSVVKLRGSMIP
jgi:hypothetical protein